MTEGFRTSRSRPPGGATPSAASPEEAGTLEERGFGKQVGITPTMAMVAAGPGGLLTSVTPGGCCYRGCCSSCCPCQTPPLQPGATGNQRKSKTEALSTNAGGAKSEKPRTNLADAPGPPRTPKERSGSYPFPPFQLTEDPLEALVHVVKLGRQKDAVSSSIPAA